MDREIIRRIVKASGVKKGELILIHFWGEDRDKRIANDFMVAAAELGAAPVLLQEARSVNRDIFAGASEESFGERYFSVFSRFDAVLDVFTYRPVVLGYEIEVAQFELYRKYMAGLFKELMKCKRFVQIRIPTMANAEESGLDPADYIKRMKAAYDVDYDELREKCARKVKELKHHKKLALYTGEDCVLHFDLTRRSWHIDAGDGDMPCGEIYIAPKEQLTKGNVFFETLYVEDVGRFEEVTFFIEDGIVQRSDKEAVNEFLRELSAENRVVCELGFGMNPNVTNLCGYTVLDEKMADTFHIAIGANHMFGGKNTASIHMDFVGRGRIEFTEE